jgi:hypothetical protein
MLLLQMMFLKHLKYVSEDVFRPLDRPGSQDDAGRELAARYTRRSTLQVGCRRIEY